MHALYLIWAAALSTVSAGCYSPEPASQICYHAPNATPQNIQMADLEAAARNLRNYQKAQLRHNKSPFWKMQASDADDCAEWRAMERNTVWVLVKHVGEGNAAVTFEDIANTLVGGAQSLTSCGTDGGQMGVRTDDGSALYQLPEFRDGGYTNRGLLVKVVHKP
ncbi:hypothetical protein CDD82_6194 [Ophiocordyceps australis]|uniref:Ecp2 effector protein domain-containing protein n=1 Tax=Ophiocordyceps australis TaxID=1399860 RepID=A0A2C5XGZ2_9HYPO|nr:hypothetical protein CDD82_6194 [Ophiocordyceps australis]